jgi:hypothetical protein
MKGDAMLRNQLILAGLLILCLAVGAAADVIVETKVNMDIIGAGKMDVSQTQYVRADRSYDKTTSKMQGGMMGGKEMVNVQIVRLDKGFTYMLEPDKKTYREVSLENMKGTMAAMQKGQAEQEADEEYVWTTEVSKDIGTEKIMDFKCQGSRAKLVGVKKDDPKDTVFVTYEQWVSDNLPGGDDFLAFSDKFAESMGIEAGFLRQMGMNPMLSRYGSQFDEVAEELGDIEGMPLKTVLIVEGTVNPMAEQMGDEEIDEETRQMMEQMGIELPGKKEEGGYHKLVSMTSEVTSIEKKKVDDAQYDIPADYSKK